MTKLMSFTLVAALATACASGPVAAQSAGSGYGAVRSRQAAVPATLRNPRSFYPENIEGGSPGNLPFNNQIRKLRDPLNANGSGR